jgi:hypothetical protein
LYTADFLAMEKKELVINIILLPIDMVVQRKSRSLTTKELFEVLCSFELCDEDVMVMN